MAPSYTPYTTQALPWSWGRLSCSGFCTEAISQNPAAGVAVVLVQVQVIASVAALVGEFEALFQPAGSLEQEFHALGHARGLGEGILRGVEDVAHVVDERVNGVGCGLGHVDPSQ